MWFLFRHGKVLFVVLVAVSIVFLYWTAFSPPWLIQQNYEVYNLLTGPEKNSDSVALLPGKIVSDLLRFNDTDESSLLSAEKMASINTSSWKLVFLHVGKTGGTTARLMLRKELRTSLSASSKRKVDILDALWQKMRQSVPVINATVSECHKLGCSYYEEDKDAVSILGPMFFRRNTSQAVLFDGAIISIRNPLKRMLSWFEYEKRISHNINDLRMSGRMKSIHIYGEILFECYNHISTILDDLVNYMNKTNESSSVAYLSSNVTSTTCRDAAYKCLTGKNFCYNHNKYNYDYYFKAYLQYIIDSAKVKAKNGTDFKPLIYVIRNNFMWQDWVAVHRDFRIRQVMHQATPISNMNRSEFLETIINFEADNKTESMIYNFGEALGVNRRTVRKEKSLDISRSNLIALCHLLCPEINLYKFILSLSANLKPADIQISVDELNQSCGDVDTSTLCKNVTLLQK